MDAQEQQFWEYVAADGLRLQRCSRCRHWLVPPGPLCPECLQENLAWEAVAGAGVVWSYTVYRHSFADHLAPRVPYCLALVELAEGPLLMGNLKDVDLGSALIGLPVRIEYGTEDGLPFYWFVPTGEIEREESAR